MPITANDLRNLIRNQPTVTQEFREGSVRYRFSDFSSRGVVLSVRKGQGRRGEGRRF